MGYTCLLCKKPNYKKYKDKATYHSFPKCPIQKQVWMNMCNVTTLIDLTYRKICNFHFEPECFEVNKKKRLLKPDAVPTIFVKRFMKKEHFTAGILEETPSIPNTRNSCILCVKSKLSYYPKTKIPLHSFPSCPEKRQAWMNRCKLTDKDISPNNKICALHFEESCYKPEGNQRLLNPDAVPTIFEMGRYYNRKKPLSGTLKGSDVASKSNPQIRFELSQIKLRFNFKQTIAKPFSHRPMEPKLNSPDGPSSRHSRGSISNSTTSTISKNVSKTSKNEEAA